MMANDYANSLYDSLFNGKAKAPSEQVQDELEKMGREIAAKVAAMTDEQKIAEFNRIMGRK